MKRPVAYIIHEYPPITQTFVWREIEALRGCGCEVYAFALNRSSRWGPGAPAWSAVSAFRNPRAAVEVAVFAFLCIRRGRAIWEVLRQPPHGVAAKLRQLKALLNAIALAALVHSHRVERPHLHAHFLGRTLDTLTYARVLLPETTTSATGHAADAVHPPSVERLRFEASRLDLAVCSSESVANRLQRTVGPLRRTAVVRYGVPVRHSLRTRLSTDVLRVCSIGRLIPKKGFDDAIRAALLLRSAETVPFHWTIIGDGPLRADLASLGAPLIRDGLLEMPGHLENDAVFGFLDEHVDLLVQPCRLAPDGDIDGIPVVLIEAMSLGIPVVTTAVSGIPELVQEGRTGFLCSPEQPATIVSILERVWRERDRTISLGLAGQATVERSFNDATEARRLAALFGELDSFLTPGADSVIAGEQAGLT